MCIMFHDKSIVGFLISHYNKQQQQILLKIGK